MSDDFDLKGAFRAVKDTYDGASPDADLTLHRALFASRAHVRRRRVTQWFLLPIAAALFASTAWAGATGRLAPVVESVREIFYAEAGPPPPPSTAHATPAAGAAAAAPSATEGTTDDAATAAAESAAASAPDAPAPSPADLSASPVGAAPANTNRLGVGASANTGAAGASTANTGTTRAGAGPNTGAVGPNGTSAATTRAGAGENTGAAGANGMGAGAGANTGAVGANGTSAATTRAGAGENTGAADANGTSAVATANALGSAGPMASAARPVDHREAALFAEANRIHFVERDPARALAAWDRYLAAAPHGSLAPEARYNRALALIRVGRTAEARGELETFANGSYRRTEARALLDALSRDAGR